MNSNKINEIVKFWFGELDEQGLVTPEVQKSWWQKNPDHDVAIRDKFFADFKLAVSGKLDSWLSTPKGRLALIILVDQFARQIYRDQASAYQFDSLAQQWVLEGIELGHDFQLPFIYRVFFYMPLEHAEDISLQEKCVLLFQQLYAEANEEHKELFYGFLDFAIKHQQVIERFGRFPHRNKILARESTPEELAFLQMPGSHF